jgi:hypothetical protein
MARWCELAFNQRSLLQRLTSRTQRQTARTCKKAKHEVRKQATSSERSEAKKVGSRAPQANTSRAAFFSRRRSVVSRSTHLYVGYNNLLTDVEEVKAYLKK